MRKPSVRLPFVATLSFLVLAACSDDTSLPTEGVDAQVGHALLGTDADVTLRAEAGRFEPGADVTLTLENGSSEVVGYNLCVHVLEERTDEGWVMPDTQPSHACILPLYLLDPSASTAYEATLPADLAPGEYRFRTGLYLTEGDGYRDQVSNPFEIEG